MRRKHLGKPLRGCLVWAIEAVGEMSHRDYNRTLVDAAKLRQQMDDPNYDDQQYVHTLDVTVYATTFAQLVLEGKIDATAKPICTVALDRQKLYAKLSEDHWPYATEYLHNLCVLERILAAA